MSMQRRMSPPDLGTTTTGLTHGVGPSAGSMISKLMSSWIFSSTFDLRLKGVLRIGCATGFISGSMWSCTGRSFNFPTPLKTSGYLSCRASPISCRPVFTAAMSISTFNTPRLVAVSLPRRGSPLPSIIQNSALTVFLSVEISQENVPITSRGVWDAYA